MPQPLSDTDPPFALGPLDGRYRPVVAPLVDHLSEAALNRERVRVEVAWLIHLVDHRVVPGVRTITDDERAALLAVVDDFDADAVARLAAYERETAHDVKAVEYFVKAALAGSSLADLTELVHFCCTSEDINNLAYALMVRGAVREVWLPAAAALTDDIAALAHRLRDQPMLAHTHGQPATPTTMGKELAVMAARLRRQLDRIDRAEYLGKLNGATGTFGAHLAAVPDADWAASRGPSSRAWACTGTRSPPRSSPTTGRPSSTPTSPASTASCTTSAPTSGPTSRSATSRSSSAPTARPAPRRCRTRSTRSASRTPRPTSRSRPPCSTSSPRPWSPRGCSAT